MKLLQHFKKLTVNPKNAQELKGLVLQLAIQGKLTANWRAENPVIEPASELLERIQKEKEQLIKEKKLKKEKKLPSIQDTEKPYDLVENWIWCRLQDIIKISSGKGLTAAKMDKTGKIPVYGGNGVTGYHSLGNVEKPTIVIGRVGFYCGSIHLTENVAWVTDNAFITYFSEDNIFRDFLLLLLRGTNLKENENATAQPVISGRKVYPIVISLPPLEEQKEIVKVVETLFKEVEQLEQLTVKCIGLKENFVTSALNQLTSNNAKQEWTFLQDHFKSFFSETTNIKKLREAVLQLAVQGKLTADWRQQRSLNGAEMEDASQLLKRIQEEKAQLIKDKKIKKEKALPLITKDEIPYNLPEGWVWSNILDISLKVTDGEHATPIRTESGYKLLSARNVTNEGIRLHKVDYVGEEEFLRIRKRCNPQKGDVLISCSGSVGRVCLVDKDDEYCMVRSAALVKQHHDFINGMYLCYALRSPVLQAQIISKSRSTAQSNLFLGKIKELIFPLPPLEEQKAIVEKVNALLGLCDALEQEVQQSQAHSEQLMQSVLREVFEGEKEVAV
tara:strand:- start:15355 stop:17031 length:1677 start_codon:yes stop_codon:yes gene_type:complete